MEEDELVGPTLLREVGEDAVDFALHFFLADEGVSPVVFRFPRKIEELVARERAPGSLDLRRAVEVEHVAHVARGVAREPRRIGREELEVFLERQHAAPLSEAALHRGRDFFELRERAIPRAHGPYSTFTVNSSGCLSMRQLAAEQTLSDNVPATFV